MKIGFLTIGQSPRIDVTAEISPILGSNFEIYEAGALDGLSSEDIKRLEPSPGEITYVSRLKDGSEIKLSRERIIPLLMEKVKYLERLGVKCIGLLCSGVFPELYSRVPLVKPEPILRGMVESISNRNIILGVIMPSPRQINMGLRKWMHIECSDVVVESFSPYIIERRTENIRRVAEKFKGFNVNLAVMDCIGFTFKDAVRFKSFYNIPVLTARFALISGLKAVLNEVKF